MNTATENASEAASTTPGPRIYTWVSERRALGEQARVVVRGERLRARGHVIAAQTEQREAYTLTYDVEVDLDGQVRRVGLESVTLKAERSINLRRDAEGEWLLENGVGEIRRVGELGVKDVQIDDSMLFVSLAVQGHRLHRQPGETSEPALYVDPATLEVSTVSVEYRSDDAMVYVITPESATSAHVDTDGVVLDVPGSVVRW